MISYFGLETLTRLHIEELQREAAGARLTALVFRAARPGYRQRLAERLRSFACRVDPTCQPAVGRNPLIASSANAGC